ncbi:ABC-type enterobactin transport system, permease component [Hahella chejuensis KCTC 2396]|uniref:ABC-type enterobactin transport system, permease component n=1 Tax=Hahella chejuensis (strain KCTC 2396) TaxID=349521 RepID=Q2SGM0_HAHCH|nr:iron ABC transporter permease [Hahella chejuensis]ABC30204.1 ABC-type enterobactin transport system, permease component [Hahella chejuensis KCTC 2396]
MHRLITLRMNRWSVQINPRSATLILLIVAASLTLALIAIATGSLWISPLEVIKELSASEPGDHAFIIETLRLPRVLMAFLAGAALALSGLILQSIIRNPLASPDIIGVTSGASAAAVFFLSFLAGAVSIRWLPVAAILGAACTSLLIYALAWRQGVSPIRLVLIGIGLSAGLSALTTLMIVISPIATSMTAYVWLTGSVYGSEWSDVQALAPWLLILGPLSLLLARTIDIQEMGDAIAINLGVPVQRNRFILLWISVALAGSAVAYTGAIGFVGLIAPHMARRLVDRSFASLAPVAAMIGGGMVALADTIGRTAFLPLDIPAGVFVSGVGAPFFIYLLYRQRHH